MRISDWSSDVCSSDLPGLSVRLHRLAIGPTDALAVTPPRRREEHVGDLRDGRVRLTVDIMPRGQRPQHTVVRVPEHLQHVAQGANRRERRRALQRPRSEEHTSELQSLMRISYAVCCLKKKKKQYNN